MTRTYLKFFPSYEIIRGLYIRDVKTPLKFSSLISDRERHPPEVLYFFSYRPLCLGSNMSLRASPAKAKPIPVIVIATPGNTNIQGAVDRY
ncbi:MAG: hypothetical protein CM1200mP35_07920 [Chloroflexota bacterium]|nr:MAG: hypothetical protein CM1200mP35_07920 [Chloroflexota bacterium]